MLCREFTKSVISALGGRLHNINKTLAPLTATAIISWLFTLVIRADSYVFRTFEKKELTTSYQPEDQA